MAPGTESALIPEGVSMMDQDINQQFLTALFDAVKGDTGAQVSMYTLGEGLDMDRDAALGVAEALMGDNLVEVRSLSGAIGLTSEGVEQARALGGGTGAETAPRLNSGTVLSAEGREAVETVLGRIRDGMPRLRLTADQMETLAIDLKTLDVQMLSPAPRTGIIRECFRSMGDLLDKVNATETAALIGGLLGDK